MSIVFKLFIICKYLVISKIYYYNNETRSILVLSRQQIIYIQLLKLILAYFKQDINVDYYNIVLF